MTYQNYHRHSYFSNIITADSTVTNEDYAKRAVELGHKLISSVEHGYCGRYIETYELAEKYGLKPIIGCETYLVKDRLEKDKTNAHLILLAKNENGRQAINDIISEANITGYYYKARIDLPLLFSLPQKDVWVTTACVGGIWKYEDSEDLVMQISEYFGNNFFLEVQNHSTPLQIALNSKILDLSNKNNIKIIFGCDSHVIKPEQSKDREDFLLSKKIVYEDEGGWNLDYASDEEVYKRFDNQGVLSKAQINEAIDNTNIFLDVEDYNGNIFNKEIKMPTLYPDKTQEEKDKIFVDEIWCEWGKEKVNIPQEKWEHYEEEINKEIDIVVGTKHSDYFLLNQRIISHAREMGGVITLSGRGSGVSFYINKLLGFTEVDRISASIKMYPERFMSKTRILEAKTLADFDMNLANPEVFAQAQKDVLGEECSYPMIAFGTMKPKAAFKMYARAREIPFETANLISDQIGKYEDDLKHADEDEPIDVLDYIEPQYHDIFLGSKKYLGIVSDVKIAPCGYLVYSGNIRKEIGLIRLNSANGTQHICTILDGAWAENFKFLKNDLLKVSVVELIDNVYKRIGVKPHTVNELLSICDGNKKVWEVYKNGWTMGINQVEQHGTRSRASKYAPKNISELSAFVAAVRPGFASMYKTFESREQFEYGIQSFDKLIQTPELPMSFVLYQEQSMATLNYAGIPMTECYEIIKNIAKKRVEKVLKYKETFINGFTKKIMDDEGKTAKEAKELSGKVWQILEDSSRYSFNACIVGSTLLDKAGLNNKYNPTVEEMYMIMNDSNYAKTTGHFDLHKKYKRNGYGNALSMFEDGKIRKNKIINIFYSGVRDVYRVSTENGSNITCTMNHKFPTLNGIKHLSELKVGDELFTKGNYEKNTKPHNFTNGIYESNLPQKGQRGFQPMPDGASVVFIKYQLKNKLGRKCCEICGEPYSEATRFELHHKDGDETNNIIENYLWCCVSCHKKEHYKMGRTKVFGKGIHTNTNKIISIEYVGKEKVYDIEMQDPAHTFITISGLVTSNSHSYCVALDSLYGAYLKSHYPLEFYEVFMKILEDGGDKDRLAATKEEAERAYHIVFPRFSFGQDNRNIVSNTETNEITSSLKSIKGFGSEVGETMLSLSNEFDGKDFLEFLVFAEEKSVLSSKFESLIKIDYFNMFGNNKKLLDIYNEFKSGTNRYNNKLKDATKIKRLEQLRILYDSMPNDRLPFMEQLITEEEILGYMQLTIPDISKKYVYVMTLDTKYAPRIQAYCLANGKQQSLKIYRKIYDNNPFGGGEILFCKSFKQKAATKFVNGEYVNSEDEFTWWLEDYIVVSEEEFNNMLKEKDNGK